jgi:hypothetical protein
MALHYVHEADGGSPNPHKAARSMSYERYLKLLDDKMSEYIRSVGEFQYENVTYTVTNHYFSDDPKQCQICGHTPIFEIYVVTNTKSETFIVGNVCIDKLSNKKIAKWYKEYRRRRDTLEKNKHLLDIIAKLPDRWSPKTQKLAWRIGNGYNPTKKQRESLKSVGA